MPRILGCGLRGWTRPPSIPPAEGAALLLTCRGPSFPPVCPLGDPAQHRDSPWGAQSSRRGPLPNWTQGLGLGGAPASPALVSSSMSPSVFLGGFISDFMWPCVCPTHITKHSRRTESKPRGAHRCRPRGVRGFWRRVQSRQPRVSWVWGSRGGHIGAPALQTPVSPLLPPSWPDG